MCSLQRPLDTRISVRIGAEAEAIIGVLSLVEEGHIELVASDALAFETGRNPHPIRKRHALEALSKAKHFVYADACVEERARKLQDSNLQPLDALHLASAIESDADYFCTL